jgi:Polyprenyl synthetase.
VLVILVCEALGGRLEDALPGAVAIELAHAASLDLDDIIDFDVIRRED